MDLDLDTIADAYLCSTAQLKRDGQLPHEDWWSYEEVQRLVRTDLNRGFAVVLLLVTKAETDSTVGEVAAGPLEDLLDVHSHKALDLVEQACGSSPRLQLALSLVGMSFWHELFERWYALKYKYGLAESTVADPKDVVVSVMQSMKNYSAGRIDAHTYRDKVVDLLSKPLYTLDEQTKRLLQAVDWDIEMAEPSELKAKVSRSLAELASLGPLADA